ncbi:MAG: hypothetical protein GXY94_05645, partial [Bacteroidales bacterium]|nr:hypothetical protein [Bacteroidales bacterium]
PFEFLSINPTTGEVEGASVAFSNANGSFTAGMGVGVSKSHANVQYVDVNGDGLPDRVETTTGDKPETRVMLNTGSGFTGIAEGFSWGGTVQRQHNINANTNAAFTFGFTVGPWPVKIVFNPSVELSQSFSRTVEQLMDLDGDGYPDFVTSASSGELKVNYSKIGKTNMLKKVNLPLGASFTLDYEQTQNSFEMPNRQWVLTAVETNDMHPGDGADITRAEFEYGSGYYDRYERTFYGFDKVVSKQIDTENGNAVYRSEEQLFENKSYYTQSMMYQSTVSDGAGLIYMQTKNDFAYRAIENPGSDASVKTITADDLSDYCKGTLSVFPHLKSTVNYYYEGATEAGKSYYKEFDYDSKGNISEYRNFGDRENGDKTIYGTVVYHQNSDKYIYNIPEEIVVKSEGKQYRQRKTVINDKGQITRVQHFIDQGDYAEVELQYNDYGNISKKILPPNYKDERMFFEYEYDKQVFSYPVKVSDAFGYSSSTEYDFKYGVPVLSTDMNNNNMRFEYDEKGRLTRVIGPKELASGAPFTIEHEYAHDALPAFGITRHFDVANPGDYIETAIFTDPLGRVLQTKRDGTILVNDNLSVVNKEEPQFAEVMVVSGKVIYDAFGRVTETYYPTTEALGAIATFNSSVDAVDPTTMTYDVLDRELTTTLPDGSIIKNEYGFGEDRDGVMQFATCTTDPMDNSSTAYNTVRGWQTATLMPDDIWLSTIYDDIGQVVEVRDHDDNITYNDYDALGRRLQRKHPDAGITKWAYDKTGNVLSFHPEHIENPIEYEYEYSRLTKVKYPNNPHNNVSYEYGAPGAENNGAGRLVKQIDGTGAQIFAYGDMGELTRNLRTVVVPDKGKYSFLTVWEYDSWNRLTAMYYPDGEELSY